MRHLTRVLVLMFAALVLAAAGCGGDDDEGDAGATGATGASGGPLTREEFIAQADEICKQGDRAVNQEGSELFGGQQPSAAEVEQFANEILVPSLRDQAAGIRSLTPPEGDEDEIDAILAELESATDRIEEDPSLLQASEGSGAFEEVNQMAQGYGFTECGAG